VTARWRGGIYGSPLHLNKEALEAAAAKLSRL
jgi:hypothetical protein